MNIETLFPHFSTTSMLRMFVCGLILKLLIYCLGVSRIALIYFTIESLPIEHIDLPLFFFPFSGDVRCHCNQPACVRTGYMCKSRGPQAACFVEHSGFMNVDRSSDISRHGCIEMLPIEERTPCLDQALETFASQNGGSVRAGHAHRHHKSGQNHGKSITCCLDDMCNYVKTIIKDEEQEPEQYKPRTVPTDPWIPLNTRNPSNKNENIDSLGKHLQESIGINGLCLNSSKF